MSLPPTDQTEGGAHFARWVHRPLKYVPDAEILKACLDESRELELGRQRARLIAEGYKPVTPDEANRAMDNF
jgi:hypothetical protein